MTFRHNGKDKVQGSEAGSSIFNSARRAVVHEGGSILNFKGSAAPDNSKDDGKFNLSVRELSFPQHVVCGKKFRKNFEKR